MSRIARPAARSAPALVPLLLLVAGGCSDPGPAPAPAPPSAAPVVVESSGRRSAAGKLALRVLLETGTLTGARAGDSRELPLQARAFRILLREEAAVARSAFAELRENGREAGKLFGLCGAWFTDRAAFERTCAEWEKAPEDRTVRVFEGCIPTERPVADVVRRISTGEWPVELAGGDGLTEGGRFALQVLLETETFASATLGLGMEVPPYQVDAFRILLREEAATSRAAFAELRADGMEAGKLYGLCGAWFTDRPDFERIRREFLEEEKGATVERRSGCEIHLECPVTSVVEDIASGRLPDNLAGRK